MPLAAFQGDYQKVLASRPDFITLNEVSRRSGDVLGVEGYQVYRSTRDAATAETPVLWDSTKWALVNSGTEYLTTRQVKWGVRAVNWVTVKSLASGRVVSVVSAHPAPTVAATRGLLPIFMQRLAGLANRLGAHGAVLVGGDLNVGYRGAAWPFGALAAGRLVTTYDLFGRFPGGTGDHFGATIDYLLFQAGNGMTPLRHGKWEQVSDHDAIWGEFTFDTPALVMSDTPLATVPEKKAAR